MARLLLADNHVKPAALEDTAFRLVAKKGH